MSPTGPSNLLYILFPVSHARSESWEVELSHHGASARLLQALCQMSTRQPPLLAPPAFQASLRSSRARSRRLLTGQPARGTTIAFDASTQEQAPELRIPTANPHCESPHAAELASQNAAAPHARSLARPRFQLPKPQGLKIPDELKCAPCQGPRTTPCTPNPRRSTPAGDCT